jgi:hypothetical protein
VLPTVGGRTVNGMETDTEVTGHGDPVGETPWAMQLVVRIEKTDPPERTAVCEAAARAVVALLADPRSGPEGVWADQVGRWTRGRIRKHCRRARGAAWARVQMLPGVTVAHAGAEVRALVPTALDDLPAELRRLQLSGMELTDRHDHAGADPVPSGPVLVAITPEPVLPLGKAAAAAGHAAQMAWSQMAPPRREAWAAAGFPVQVTQLDLPRWSALQAAAPVVVRDAGFTVVTPGTCTAVATWI